MSTLDLILSQARGARPMKSAAQAQYPTWLRAGTSAERDRIPATESVERQATLYDKLSWVQIAIGVRARLAAAVPFEVRQIVGEETQAIKNHPFELRLREPNPKESRFQLLEATFAWRALTGNAYWYLNRANENAEPDELWVIPSHQIQPVPDGNMFLKGYKYDAGEGQPILLEPWEVVPFPTWNPLSKYVGLSPLGALRFAAYGDLYAQEFNANFYGPDNAKMSGILAFGEYIEQGKWDRMMAQMREEYGGKKRKLIMPLRGVGTGSVSWLPTAMSQEDMQYLEQRQFTKEEIFAIFAPGLASMLAINANEANARTGDATLSRLAIYPDHVAVAETITNGPLRSYGENLIGEFEDVRHKDRQLEIQEIDQYAKFHTINEVRKEWYDDDDDPNPERGLKFAAEIKAVAGGGGGGASPFGTAPIVPEQDQAAVVAAGKALDRRRWQEKAIKAALRGRGGDVAFDPEFLNDGEAMAIRAALKRATSPDDVLSVFREG